MKKLYTLFVAILLAMGLLAACGNNTQPKKEEPITKDQSEATEEASFPVTIKDGIDKDVVIEKKPEKVVSLMPSNTEIVYALGDGDSIIGVTEIDNYPEEVANKEKVAGMELNVEKIISLKPDLVLAHGSTVSMWEAGFKQLEDSGVTVLVVNDAQSFGAVFASIEMVGKAFGAQDKADSLVKEMKEKLGSIKKQAAEIKDPKTVFVEVSPAPEIYATGKKTFIDEMLTTINAENAVTEDGWVQMNEEAIIALNPDVIVTTYGDSNAPAQILERTGWQDVSAVKEKQVQDVNADLVSRSGPRIVEGVEELAKAIYPDVFGK